MALGEGAQDRAHHHRGLGIGDVAERIGERIPGADPVLAHGVDAGRRGRQLGVDGGDDGRPAAGTSGHEQDVAVMELDDLAQVGQGTADGLPDGPVDAAGIDADGGVHQGEGAAGA
ncbi:hypothetical protein DSECCO2_565650 [anaerobic digester metagenome]